MSAFRMTNDKFRGKVHLVDPRFGTTYCKTKAHVTVSHDGSNLCRRCMKSATAQRPLVKAWATA